MRFVENVMPALKGFLDEGRRIALVTLINVEGSSPRPVGSQIGVSEDGRHAGMITGGCAEKAIVAEALRCIDLKENRIVRYGAGSPYVDVVLPCGSGVDLHFEVRAAADIVRDALALRAKRQSASLRIDLERLSSRIDADASAADDAFIRTYHPDYRIMVFGEGANLLSFCRIATAAGFTVCAFSPDESALAIVKEDGAFGRPIHQAFDFSALDFDAHTAVVTLFHEHDWEIGILRAALNSDAHHIGALGSRMTHRARLERLGASPATRRPPDIIHGPIGLDIGAQDPNEIAIAILAEIVAKRRRDGR